MEYLLFPAAFTFLIPVAYGVVDAITNPSTEPFFRWITVQWWCLPGMIVLLIPIMASCYYFFRKEYQKYERAVRFDQQIDLWEQMGYSIVPPPLWAKIGIWIMFILAAFMVYTTFDPRLLVWLINY